MNKKYLIIGLIVLAVIAGGIVFWQKKVTTNNQQAKAYEFAGRIVKIEGNVIYMKGPFVLTEQPEMKVTDYETDMQTVVGSNTKLIKLIQTMPTQAELEKTNGFYEPSKLKSTEVAGSLQDLIDGATDGIFAKSDKNIINKKSFTATEIKYAVREYPQN